MTEDDWKDDVGDDIDEEDDNIEWEEGSKLCCKLNLINLVVDTTVAQEPPSSSSADVCEENFNPPKKKQKSMRVKHSQDVINELILSHQMDVSHGLKKAIDNSSQSNNEILSAMLISLLPPDLLISHTLLNIASLKKVSEWFSNYFKVIDDKFISEDEGLHGSSEEFLLSNIIPNAAGSQMQLHQLLTALLRGLGYRTRLVSALSPRSFVQENIKDHRLQRRRSCAHGLRRL